MALQLGRYFSDSFDRLRFEPTAKRLRVYDGGALVCDTTGGVLVWEPRRVVPMYAVPEADLTLDLVPCGTPAPPDDLPRVLGPGSFDWHLHDGQSLARRGSSRADAFRPLDPDLSGLVLLDWDAFEWWEEDAVVIGHPHDPFHRVDAVPSDRHVVVTDPAGEVLAESSRPVAVFETGFPVRWYVPRDDVRLGRLAPSETTTTCAYKGVASYFSLPDGEPDVAWSYVDALPEVIPARGHLCFDERWTRLSVT
jgi:uncharacterized protein (DUF427 family)